MYTPNYHATHAHLSWFAYSESLIELVKNLFCPHMTAEMVVHSVVYGVCNREPDSTFVFVIAAQDIGPADTLPGGRPWGKA